MQAVGPGGPYDSHAETLQTSFAIFYSDASRDILTHAQQNLENITKAGKSGKELYFEEGSILVEKKGQARTLESRKYCDTKNLSVFFEKMATAVEACSDELKLCSIANQLPAVKEGLVNLKLFYEKKYAGSEHLKLYKEAFEYSLVIVGQMEAKAHPVKQNAILKTQQEFNKLQENMLAALAEMKKSEVEIHKQVSMKWEGPLKEKPDFWEKSKITAIRNCTAAFGARKKELEDAVAKMHIFKAQWQDL